jgi:hypothetical protein
MSPRWEPALGTTEMQKIFTGELLAVHSSPRNLPSYPLLMVIFTGGFVVNAEPELPSVSQGRFRLHIDVRRVRRW